MHMLACPLAGGSDVFTRRRAQLRPDISVPIPPFSYYYLKKPSGLFKSGSITYLRLKYSFIFTTSLGENESHLCCLFRLIHLQEDGLTANNALGASLCNLWMQKISTLEDSSLSEELTRHMKGGTGHVLNWWQRAHMLPAFRRKLIFIECLLDVMPYARQYPLILVITC